MQGVGSCRLRAISTDIEFGMYEAIRYNSTRLGENLSIPNVHEQFCQIMFQLKIINRFLPLIGKLGGFVVQYFDANQEGPVIILKRLVFLA